MTTKEEKKLRDTVRETCVELISIQRRLHDVGLSLTAKRVNEATQEMGWEAAALFDRVKGREAFWTVWTRGRNP